MTVSSVELLHATASDLMVVNAARVSFGKVRTEIDESDEKLISFLMRNGHSSPFRHGYFQFRVKTPIFVQRDHFRHTAGHDYNEISTRYVEMDAEFYDPDRLRVQMGRPGAYFFRDAEPTLHNEASLELIHEGQVQAYVRYQELLDRGVPREQAMAVLPMGTMTEYIWSCNPLALMNFIEVRSRREARAEIQEIARLAFTTLEDTMPLTALAFIKRHLTAP